MTQKPTVRVEDKQLEQPTAPIKPHDNVKKSLSRGEIAFNWTVYGGIAGIGVFIMGMPFAHWAKYGKGTKWFGPTGSATKAMENMGLSNHTANEVLITTTLMQGGNVGVIPVKWAENYKPEIVEKLNQLLGDTTSPCTEKEPKQTWSSLVKARLLAWAAAFTGIKGGALLLGPEKFAAFEEKFAKNLICRPFGKATHINGKETKWFEYGKIGALDFLATATAATLLYVGSRIFAKGAQRQAAEIATSDPTATLERVAEAKVDCCPTDKIKPQGARILSTVKTVRKENSHANMVTGQRKTTESNAPQLGVL